MLLFIDFNRGVAYFFLQWLLRGSGRSAGVLIVLYVNMFSKLK